MEPSCSGWAKEFARANGLSSIQLDTGSGNARLINYYVSNGFTLVGDTRVNYTPDLPAHYENGSFALFQMNVFD